MVEYSMFGTMNAAAKRRIDGAVAYYARRLLR